jgi:hypothetical protein
VRAGGAGAPIVVPALGHLPPGVLKRVLELDGFLVEHEDDYNWILTKPSIDEAVIVPKLGPFVATDVLDRAVAAAPTPPKPYLFSRP